MSGRRAGIILGMGMVIAALGGAAGAEESKYQKMRADHPALFKLYYDETVMAYCGLLTPESVAGFELERDAMLAEDSLDGEGLRTLRVAADMAADYAYQDYGLNGQKRWCGTAGRDAYHRFVARHRASVPDGQQSE